MRAYLNPAPGRPSKIRRLRVLLICLCLTAALASASTTHASTTVDPSDKTIDLTLSDDAQEKTIAFDGMAFLTGDLCSDTFFPPGKVSDFFGFQYLRDNMPDGYGHNTAFAGIAADNVLSVLTDDQVAALVALAQDQETQVDAYGYKRFVLIKAFRRLLEQDLPDGTTGLDKDAVQTFSADLYEIDALISYKRAEVIGGIISALDDTQKSYLDTLAQTEYPDWPTPASPIDKTTISHAADVLVSTYAGQLLSWYTGTVASDTYFCPERHGTYFGSFYLKDIPPMMSPTAVNIDENLTAEMGEDFLNILDASQSAEITGLVDTQRDNLDAIVALRTQISQELRKFMVSAAVDESTVVDLVRQYGALDGANVYEYAKSFAAVGNALTQDQAAQLTALRESYNTYACTGAYLYSDSIDMPDIPDTDFLFGIATDDDTDGSAADPDCLEFGDDYSLAISCAEINGAAFSFTLDYLPTQADMYWTLDQSSLAQTAKTANCLAINANYDIQVPCAGLQGADYSFALDYYPDLQNIMWKLNPASLNSN